MNMKRKLLLIIATFILSVGTAAFGQPLMNCDDASPIACGETQTNQTPPGEEGAGNVAVYCENDTFTYENAWEFIYEFTLDQEYEVIITMTYEHRPQGNDLDMGLYGSCDETDCLDASYDTTGFEEMTELLSAGTYYINVDGYLGYQDGSPHTMTLVCRDVVATEAKTWSSIKELFR